LQDTLQKSLPRATICLYYKVQSTLSCTDDMKQAARSYEYDIVSKLHHNVTIHVSNYELLLGVQRMLAQANPWSGACHEQHYVVPLCMCL
jgi:hypothetical protein